MKKCKGTGKAKGHGCGKLQEKRIYGLGLECRCYQSWLFGTEEGAKVVESRTIKAKRDVSKEKKKAEKERIDSMKSISALIQESRTPFQKWIRFRDANDGCISCGSTTADIYHAGHYFKAETYRGLIFDEMNVNKQCSKCNIYLNGNESAYREGLVRKYGEEAVKALEERANELRAYQWDREEIKAIKKEYQKRLRDDIRL